MAVVKKITPIINLVSLSLSLSLNLIVTNSVKEILLVFYQPRGLSAYKP